MDQKEIIDTEVSSETAETDSQEENRPLEKTAKKAAGFGAAGLAAVSLFLGSIFSAPAEILNNSDAAPEKNTVVIEMQVDSDEAPDEDPDEDSDEKKKSFKEMVRAFVLGLPLAVRLFLILPLWIIGYGLLAMLTALFEPVIAPVLSVVLKWLLVAGLLLFAFFLVKKAIAPNTPIKEILSKRNLLGVGIAAIVLGTGDYFLREYVEHYEMWRNIACAGAGAVILAVFAARMLNKQKKS